MPLTNAQKQARFAARRKAKLERLAVLEGALRWYADPANWWVRNSQQRGYHRMGQGSLERHAGQPGTVTDGSDALMAGQFIPDAGDRARKALGDVG